ncbi:MAG: NAD(P)H-hydrate epimerase [Tepidisphaeraceae bacterium]
MLRLTRNQSREVDRIAIEEFGIPGIVLMENAARSAVDAMVDLLTPGKLVGIVCGGGNNGGDGFAVARHLINRGHNVQVYIDYELDKLRGDAAINFHILRNTGVPLRWSGRNAGLLQARGRLV